MSYDAKVFRVFIASPGDVKAERDICREVISEWNAIHSMSKGAFLQPVMWEMDAVSDVGSHPQDNINNELLENSDLLIGVFWSRIGSETKEYQSGTIEELTKHVEMKKPAMIFFSNALLPNYNYHLEQRAEVAKFKDEIKTYSTIIPYNGEQEFREVFRKQLYKKLKDKYFKVVQEETNSNKIKDSRIPIIELSDEAEELLLAVSKDQSGCIYRSESNWGTSIGVGQKQFVTDNSPRNMAKWGDALKQLEDNNLVETDYKRQIFNITQKGFDVADSFVEVEIL